MLPIPTHKTQSEHEQLVHLAQEYEQKGYQVNLYPQDAHLPEPLKGCLVGLVAEAKGKFVVADVRNREHLTRNGPEDLRAVARGLEKVPNSTFDLVVFNPELHHA